MTISRLMAGFVFLLLLVTIFCAFKPTADMEQRINLGMKVIARYYDSLSFVKGDRLQTYYFVQRVGMKKGCDSGNFCILPIQWKEDLLLRQYNNYLCFGNRYFILDHIFDQLITEKLPVESKIRSRIYDNLPSSEGWNICREPTIYYSIGCPGGFSGMARETFDEHIRPINDVPAAIISSQEWIQQFVQPSKQNKK